MGRWLDVWQWAKSSVNTIRSSHFVGAFCVNAGVCQSADGTSQPCGRAVERRCGLGLLGREGFSVSLPSH